ncbi:MAG: ROK family protein [candidate division Zixibacteria bacterium]|nr:ROK family protein [candidate division Zixibacteria bacterium]
MTDNQVLAGIDIGGTSVKFGLFDTTGKILHKERRPTMPEKGATVLMHLVTNIAERLLYFAAEEDYDVHHLGVGTPGAVDFNAGKVIGTCPNIDGWQGMEIATILKERLNMPVWVDNDVNAMALSELHFGAARGAKSVVCVTVGTGVGGAVMFDGKLWRGANHSAGELGHMSIDYDSPQVHSGIPGSIESFCASKAIIGRLKEAMTDGMTPAFEKVLDGDLSHLTIRKLFAAERARDELAISTIDEAARYLGTGLAGVVNLLNPEVVVIGGGIAEGGVRFVETATATIRELAFDSAVEKLTVVRASLGNDAGFVGAGLLGEIG